jgi:hypothetical protein
MSESDKIFEMLEDLGILAKDPVKLSPGKTRPDAPPTTIDGGIGTKLIVDEEGNVVGLWQGFGVR